MQAVSDPGRAASGVLAVVVHVVFFGLLVVGISWQKRAVSPVFVELWQDLPRSEVIAPTPKPKPVPPEPKPEPKPAPKPEPKPEPKPAPPPPKAEAPQPTQAEIELKEKLRKQQEEDLKRKQALQELEEKKARVEEAKRRLEQEQRAREEEARKREQAKQLAEELRREEEVRRVEQAKREDEARRRAAEAEQQRREAEAARKAREADEARARAEAAARSAQQKLVDDFKFRIGSSVRSRVVLPPDMQGNPEALYEVILLPGGDVLEATLRKSSGVPAYDAAVARAIMAAQPLPVPSDPALFQEHFRRFNMSFRPRE